MQNCVEPLYLYFFFQIDDFLILIIILFSLTWDLVRVEIRNATPVSFQVILTIYHDKCSGVGGGGAAPADTFFAVCEIVKKNMTI